MTTKSTKRETCKGCKRKILQPTHHFNRQGRVVSHSEYVCKNLHEIQDAMLKGKVGKGYINPREVGGKEK